jgi:enoyl-CoA hydratase
MNDYEFLRWEVDGPVATVWLSRAPVNAVNQAMYKEIQRRFAHIDELGPDIRAVVLAADGKHFCAGNDLNDFETLTPDNGRERMFNAREAFWAIRECEVPVIGAIHGMALGSGLAITASCDVVIASEDATLGLPEIKVGVMGGGKHLSRLLPQGIVRYMFFTGEPLAASEYARFGGVLKVVERDALLEEATALARQMARHSPVALRMAKRGLNEIEYVGLKPGYELEQGLTSQLSSHPHAKEALHAFREKREPDYNGAAAPA